MVCMVWMDSDPNILQIDGCQMDSDPKKNHSSWATSNPPHIFSRRRWARWGHTKPRKKLTAPAIGQNFKNAKSWDFSQ